MPASAVGRGEQIIDAQRHRGDQARSGREIGLCLVFLFFRTIGCGRGGVARDGGGYIEREDRVAALGGAILHDILPFFLVVVLLRLAPGLARREVDRLRIGGPGEGVDVFFSLRDRGRPRRRGEKSDISGWSHLSSRNRSRRPFLPPSCARRERRSTCRRATTSVRSRGRIASAGSGAHPLPSS